MEENNEQLEIEILDAIRNIKVPLTIKEMFEYLNKKGIVPKEKEFILLDIFNEKLKDPSFFTKTSNDESEPTYIVKENENLLFGDDFLNLFVSMLVSRKIESFNYLDLIFYIQHFKYETDGRRVNIVGNIDYDRQNFLKDIDFDIRNGELCSEPFADHLTNKIGNNSKLVNNKDYNVTIDINYKTYDELHQIVGKHSDKFFEISDFVEGYIKYIEKLDLLREIENQQGFSKTKGVKTI